MTLRHPLALALLLACSSPSGAVRPVKTKASVVSTEHLLREAETAYQAYRFEAAQTALGKYQSAMQRRREALPERAKVLTDQLARAVRMYARAEVLHIVDSALVPKADFLRRLPQGSGRFLAEERTLPGDSLVQAVSYQDALGKNYLRASGSEGLEWLSALGAAGSGRWEESPINFTALGVNKTFTSPFLLENGVTLIYSQIASGGLGGYDLYMSRLDGNDFYLPSLLGMPYNSPANDYLLAYHESEGWGVLVSDRFAPADSLHIYRFTGRPAFLNPQSSGTEEEELSDEERFRRATLQGVLYADSLTSATPSPAPARGREEATSAGELYFVLQGDQVYRRWADFRTTEGLEAFRQAEGVRQTLAERETELRDLRQRWQGASASTRESLRAEIQLLEARVLQLRGDLKQALHRARYYEGVR